MNDLVKLINQASESEKNNADYQKQLLVAFDGYKNLFTTNIGYFHFEQAIKIGTNTYNVVIELDYRNNEVEISIKSNGFNWGFERLSNADEILMKALLLKAELNLNRWRGKEAKSKETLDVVEKALGKLKKLLNNKY